MHNPQSAPDYLLTFSSFYKAMYARDKLMEQGIGSQLRRVPTQLLRSCGQALYLNGQDLQRVLAITGILNPVVGALVHNAGSVLVIINSSLLLKWKWKGERK